MMANRHSQSALLKSKIDQLEYRLREMETSAADLRRALEELKGNRREEGPTLLPAFLAPPTPITPATSSPRVPQIGKSGPKKRTVDLMPALARAKADPPEPLLKKEEPKPLLKKQIVKPTRVEVVNPTRPTRRAWVFTQEVLDKIPVWVKQGRTREWIAEEIGCTMNSLVATCSRKGISLRTKRFAPLVSTCEWKSWTRHEQGSSVSLREW
jgi:hypothetical protein